MRQDNCVNLHIVRKSYLISYSTKKVMHLSNVGTNLLHDSLEKAVVVDVPILIYIAQSHVTYFAPGYMPKPLLSLFDYTV